MTELKTIAGELVGAKYKPGFHFNFTIAVPQVDVAEFGLFLEHDRQNDANLNAMLTLADEGKAPYCIYVGVNPGKLTMPDGTIRGMRMNSYDLFDREYADFVVYELVPYIANTYGLNLSPSPDMHMVSGGSSGGISSFVMAWFHPEYFRRVYMCSPSFLAMGRGNELPYLIRKYETKPIRIYHESSENEPNDYFGWSRGIDEETDKGLVFAGYDYRFEQFKGEGHSSRYRNEAEAYKRFEWLWKDYATKPIAAPANSPRMNQIIPFGSRWEPCDAFPAKAAPVVPDAIRTYDHAVPSFDNLTWYAADQNDDVVYLYVADDEIAFEKRILHATLHTIPRIYPKGAIALAGDATDRLYVLTAIGVQCVRSFGLIDAILDLPDDSAPVDIAVTDALYVKTQRGVYRRPLCPDCTDFEHPARKYTSYYD